jgi:CubicO group peptidase (beta-lactamase class C family)
LSNKTYIEFLNDNIFKPLNLKNIKLARTKLKDCDKDEVYYHPRKENHLVPSVFNLKNKVVESYGAFPIEELDSCMGLVSTADDILKLNLNFETLISKDIFLQISQRPILEIKNKHGWFNGLGWRVTKTGTDDYNLWYIGTVDIGGSTSFIARSAKKDKISWVALFNKSISTSSIEKIMKTAKIYFE